MWTAGTVVTFGAAISACHLVSWGVEPLDFPLKLHPLKIPIRYSNLTSLVSYMTYIYILYLYIYIVNHH